MRVMRGMRVVPAVRTGLSVTAWPAAGVKCVPRGRARERIGGEQVFKLRQLHGSGGAGVVEAAPATLAARRQTQMRWRLDAGSGKQRIQQLKQGIAAAAKQRIDVLVESSQLLQDERIHASRMGARASRCLLQPHRRTAIGYNGRLVRLAELMPSGR